jgi:hypothetical protein
MNWWLGLEAFYLVALTPILALPYIALVLRHDHELRNLFSNYFQRVGFRLIPLCLQRGSSIETRNSVIVSFIVAVHGPIGLAPPTFDQIAGE